jgi:hypothetical protein
MRRARKSSLTSGDRQACIYLPQFRTGEVWKGGILRVEKEYYIFTLGESFSSRVKIFTIQQYNNIDGKSVNPAWPTNCGTSPYIPLCPKREMGYILKRFGGNQESHLSSKIAKLETEARPKNQPPANFPVLPREANVAEVAHAELILRYLEAN